MTWLTSDNAGPAAPEVIAAVTAANAGYEKSYGADAIMARVTERIREIFEAPEASVHLVATGTAANVLSLATLVDPWNAIFCSDVSHVEWDECGAPEFYSGGAKLVLLSGQNGKIAPDALDTALAEGTSTDVHQVQRGAVSLTNATELGAVYGVDEVRALTARAKAFDLPCHMDGARFANAIVAAGCSPAEMTWKAGIDVLSFGGTKNGCMGVEAVILFDPARDWEFQLRRKRGAHLFSKHRFLSAQMEAYLADDLWLRLARQSNDATARLAAGLRSAGAEILYATDANITFATFTVAEHKRLHDAGMQYYLMPHGANLDGADTDRVACRLVTNWSTRDAEIDAFIAALR